MVQSNGIKPTSFLVPQQETTKESNPIPQPTNDAEKRKDSFLQSNRLRGSIPQSKIVGGNHDGASITPPSEQGTTVNTHEENSKPLHILINQPGSRINDVIASAVAEPGNAVAEVQRKVHFSSENIAIPRKTEWDVTKQDRQHHNFRNMEINNRGKMGVQDQFHQFGTFIQNDLSNAIAMTQSSAVGCSCATSLVNSNSAPIVTSTTYCSQHQTGGAQLVAQSPLSKPAATSQPISSNAAMSMEVNKSCGLSKDHHDATKDSCHDEINPVKENVIDVKSQPPLSDVPASDLKLEISKSEKTERAGGGGVKAASTSRRKGYDPNLFFKVNGKLYQRLGKIGSGESSEVHKVISSDCTIYALKKIKLKGRGYATAFGFCQEIEYLNRLKGKSNIIQLVDYEVTDKSLLQEVMNGSMSNKDGRVKDDGYIYMVLEYGEIDLARMLALKWKELEGSSEIIVDENWLRFYWQQILLAVTTIHEERIVHSDLKPANFVLVRGSLKLINFGIAKAIMNDTTNIHRDSQVGTLSYMSPEAFMCNETDANGKTIKCGRSSDIWSLGCILYQMVYGRTPFSEYKTFWAKFKVITNPNHEIVYEPVSNPWLLDLMKKCLVWNRNERWRIPQLVKHPFLVPSTPNKVLSPIKLKHTLFQLIAESSPDNQEALMLCSQLQSIVMDPISEVESDSLKTRDQFRKLLCMVQSNGIKPTRFLVPQQETVKESNPIPQPTNDAEKSKDDFLQSNRLRGSIPQSKIVGGNHECASITPPSEQGTTVNTHEENSKPLHILINQPGSGINDAIASAVAEPGSAVAEVQRKVHFSSENIAIPRKTEWDEAKKDRQHHNFQNMEINNRRKTGVQDQLHQFGTFLQNDLSNAVTQLSAVVSSRATSLVNSTSAPMVSSTTYCSQHQTGGAQLVAQSPLSKPAATSQPISSNAAMPMEVNKSYGLSKDHHDATKDSRHDENNPGKENVIDVKSQPPSSDVPASDLKLGSSKPEKIETAGRGGVKAASTTRRRGYKPYYFFKVNGKLYQRLGKIGSGGSSEVHKVIASDCTIYALKKIKLKGRDYATAFGFCQEIEYLNRLKGKSSIIQLVDYEVTDKSLLQEVMNGSMSNKDGRVKDDGYIYMVLEYGEIDLARMLALKWKELEGSSEIIVDENWLRFYWQQILLAVTTIHEERIVHSDLKPANFLLVRGSLKLIDFGIAKAIMNDTTNIQRDSQVGTLNYMSPEAFMCNETDANGKTIKCGRSSDIWSLGCILYQMVYGRSPFSEYKTFWAKFKAITDPNHEIVYEPVSNPWLLDLMKKCLVWDRNERWRIPQLVKHPFLVPPTPNKVLTPIMHKHPLFQLIAESSLDNEEALMLCSQLWSMVMDPVSEVESDSLKTRD